MYVTVVVPAEMPVSTPEEDIVPTAGLLVLHVPPGLRLDSGVVAPVHTVGEPVMGNTDVLTLTVAVAVVVQLPKVAVTV